MLPEGDVKTEVGSCCSGIEKVGPQSGTRPHKAICLGAGIKGGAAKGRKANAQNGKKQDRKTYFKSFQIVQFRSRIARRMGSLRASVISMLPQNYLFLLKKASFSSKSDGFSAFCT
jgi:hypothetical protein